MAKVLEKINNKFLILCEGKDVCNFINAFIHSKELSVDERFSRNIQCIDLGGINEIRTNLLVLKNVEHFDMVESILIIRDAETNVTSAMDSIKSALNNAGLPIPDCCNFWVSNTEGLRVSYTLLPTCDENPTVGTLEDLCWEIIKDCPQELKNDISVFVDKIDEEYHTISTHKHKGRIHTFFSVNDELVSLKVGEAAKAQAFDWNSEKLLGLKGLIEQGFD